MQRFTWYYSYVVAVLGRLEIWVVVAYALFGTQSMWKTEREHCARKFNYIHSCPPRETNVYYIYGRRGWQETKLSSRQCIYESNKKISVNLNDANTIVKPNIPLTVYNCPNSGLSPCWFHITFYSFTQCSKRRKIEALQWYAFYVVLVERIVFVLCPVIAKVKDDNDHLLRRHVTGTANKSSTAAQQQLLAGRGSKTGSMCERSNWV